MLRPPIAEVEISGHICKEGWKASKDLLDDRLNRCKLLQHSLEAYADHCGWGRSETQKVYLAIYSYACYKFTAYQFVDKVHDCPMPLRLSLSTIALKEFELAYRDIHRDYPHKPLNTYHKPVSG